MIEAQEEELSRLRSQNEALLYGMKRILWEALPMGSEYGNGDIAQIALEFVPRNEAENRPTEAERLCSRVAELEHSLTETSKAALDWQRRAVELGQLSDCNRARIEELEAEHTVIADATGYTRAVEAGLTDELLAGFVQGVMDNHRDYIATIRLNVPEPYRLPQLDLCMVRMRDRISELEARTQRLEGDNLEYSSREAIHLNRIAALEAQNGALREALTKIRNLPSQYVHASDAANVAIETAREALGRSA